MSAYWSIRLAWADHLSYRADLPDRERAARLAPVIASYYERVADKHEELGRDTLTELERAVTLDPENADLRMRYGLRAELAGKLALAEESLLAAAARSNLYQPRYLLAQYYFRRQKDDAFWKWSKAALEIASGDVAALLDLGWRVRPDAGWIGKHAIPQRPEIARQYLVFLAGKGEWDVAQTLALQLVSSATLADRPILLDYCDRRLSAGDASAAMEIWNAMCDRGLLPYRSLNPLSGPYLTGGEFDREPIEKGFDWHRNNPPGIAFAVRDHKIHLRLSGSQAEQCTIAWQYIPVEPGQQYRIKFRAEGANTAGVDWQALSLSGEELSQDVMFRSALNSVVKLALVYHRPRGSVPLEGTVALSDLSMERIP